MFSEAYQYVAPQDGHFKRYPFRFSEEIVLTLCTLNSTLIYVYSQAKRRFLFKALWYWL